MEGSDNLHSSGWHLKCFLFQVKQKKYEVLDEHKKKSSLNGLVRITTVTNFLSVANSKEYSQVSSADIITNTALKIYPRHHAHNHNLYQRRFLLLSKLTSGHQIYIDFVISACFWILNTSKILHGTEAPLILIACCGSAIQIYT